MVNPELLAILCCPETHEGLTPATLEQVQLLNAKIAAGEMRTRGGRQVHDLIDGALIRQDQKFAYVIRNDIPVMLTDEAVPLS